MSMVFAARARELIERHFWGLALAAAALKWILISDASFHFPARAFGDGLFVDRAYHLLSGDGFGPYGARTLARSPGMSFWIAGLHVFGVPYLLALHITFASALAVFVRAVERTGVPRLGCFAVYAGVLFAPLTLDTAWFSAGVAPASAILHLLLASAVLFALPRERPPWLAAAAIGLVAGALVVLDHDHRLLLLAGPCAALAWGYPYRSVRYASLAALVLLPLGISLATVQAARSWVNARYGAPILNEMEEGAFAELWNELERVDPADRSKVPRLSRTFAELTTWNPPALKVALHTAEDVPSLPAAQAFQRAAADDVRRGCAEGKLTCSSTAKSLQPRLLHLAIFPSYELRDDVPRNARVLGVREAEAVLHPGVPVAPQRAAGDLPPELRDNLWYWLRNADIAQSKAFGPGKLGARVHYEDHGKLEGRSWGAPDQVGPSERLFRSRVLGGLRRAVFVVYGLFDELLVLLGAVALFARRSPLRRALLVMVVLVLLRWASLPQIPTDPVHTIESSRLFHGSALLLLAFALALVAHASCAESSASS